MRKLTGKILKKRSVENGKVVFSIENGKVDDNIENYISIEQEKPPKIFRTPLTKKSLARFQKCKDCHEHPVVYITKAQVPVCERHWNWLAESNIVWDG